MPKTYADPGFRPDGKKRYPVDTVKHAVAGWSYINMPKNARLYTPWELERVKTSIKTALLAFGVEVKQSSATGNGVRPQSPRPIDEENPTLPPIRLLRAYAALGEIPMFEISTEDVHGFCVYVLLDANEQPVYVGRSKDILGRLSTHLRNAEKSGRTSRIQILKCKSKEHMVELELRLIQLYNPTFNIVGRTG